MLKTKLGFSNAGFEKAIVEANEKGKLSKFNLKLFLDPDTDAEATPSTPFLQDHVSQNPGKFGLNNRGSKKKKKPK